MFADLDRSGIPRDAACLTRRLSRLAVQIPRNAVLAVLVDVVVIDWISYPPVDGRGRRFFTIAAAPLFVARSAHDYSTGAVGGLST